MQIVHTTDQGMIFEVGGECLVRCGGTAGNRGKTEMLLVGATDNSITIHRLKTLL